MTTENMRNLLDRLHDLEVFITRGDTELALESVNRLILDTQKILEQQQD
jgi:hypothetical protein